ncbi:MAG TPA: SRPBCC domain-containing protein [Rectinemataceae bacterium]|nr:SRPBCC domain-containing protein [Rectinemataceae bacterium]
MRGFEAKTSVVIKAEAERVWRALTDPALIKLYLFGTDVDCDWKVGSPITYRGTWEGQTYEDKGKIVEFVPRRRLVSTYWSSMSGKADLPENYSLVSYTLEDTAGATLLELAQDNNDSEESAAHSTANWEMVLRGMKELLEGGKI